MTSGLPPRLSGAPPAISARATPGGRVARRWAAALAVPLLCAAGSAWAQNADLVLAQHVVAPDPVPAGGIATITMTVNNNGLDAASNVKLTDTIPSGSTFVSMAASDGGTCTTSAPYECTWASVPYPGSRTVTLRVRLPSATVWTNSAEVTSPTADSNLTNNALTRNITATAAANLALTATTSASGTIAAGTPYNYILTVGNNGGPNDLPAGQAPKVTFNVPGGSSITSRPTGAGWTCQPSSASSYPLTAPTAGVPGALVTCSRDDSLAVGASFPSITVPAVANVTGTVTGTFTVNSNFADGDTTDNTKSVNVDLSAGTDMSITKTAALAAAAGGTQATFTLTARQQGGAAPTGVTVTDTLPAGLNYVSHNEPAPWNCAFAIPTRTLTCTDPGIYTGGPFTDLPAITLVAAVTGNGNIPNTGIVSATPPDPVGTNDTSIANVNNTADLEIRKWASISPVVVGQDYNWEVTARNYGPMSVLTGQTITVVESIPLNMTVLNNPSDGDWTCTSSAGATYPQTGPVTLTCAHTRLTNLTPTSSTPRLLIPVENTVAGALTNNVCFASPPLSTNGPTEAGDGNGSAGQFQPNCRGVGNTATTTSADLGIVKSVSPALVAVGQDLTYTLVATNHSTVNAATNVHVYDTINNLVGTGSLQSITNPHGTCTPAGPYPLNGASQVVDCDVGTLAANGGSATVTIVVRPNNSTAAVIARPNTATVNSLDVGDVDRGNNSATVNSNVAPRVDATVTKSVTPSANVRVGEPMVYTVTARNVGPSIANELIITDVMPPNTAFISVGTPSNSGTCATVPAVNSVGGTLSCRWTAVAANSTRTVTFTVRPLAAALNTTISNTVNVAVGATDVETNLANNSDTATTNVIDSLVDILVQKTDGPDPVDIGLMTTYTITIGNAGPSVGTNLVMVDTFPTSGSTARFSYQGNLTATVAGASVTPSCTEPSVGALTGTLTCTFPTIGVGTSNEVVLTYRMRAESIVAAGAYSGTQGNHVAVSVAENETQMTNNQVSEDTTTSRVAPPAGSAIDLGIVKTTSSGPALPGTEFDYTLTVTNHQTAGSGRDVLSTHGVQVTDTLPAGLSFVSATGCSYASGSRQLTCIIPTLAAGASTAFTLRVRVDSPYTGPASVSNTACVDMPGDPVGSNNCSTVPKTVTAPPPTSIPTLSEWSLIALSMLLAAFALRRMPQRASRRM